MTDRVRERAIALEADAAKFLRSVGYYTDENRVAGNEVVRQGEQPRKARAPEFTIIATRDLFALLDERIALTIKRGLK
jgi:hypothetical protein